MTSTVVPALLRRGATVVAAGRVALGLTALIWPSVPARPWVGASADDLAARVFGRALGARDVALGLGALAALREAAANRGPAAEQGLAAEHGLAVEQRPAADRGAAAEHGLAAEQEPAADRGAAAEHGLAAEHRSADESRAARAWVAAGALSDALDVAASLASWRELPRTGRWMVAASAGGAALAGAAGALAMRPGQDRCSV